MRMTGARGGRSSCHFLLDVVSRLLYQITLVAVATMIAAIVVATFAQVVARLWGAALSWTQETGRYLLIWVTFLGGSMLSREGAHISIQLFPRLTPRLARWQATLVVASEALLYVVIIWFGLRMLQVVAMQRSTILQIPMAWVYASLPVSTALMLIHRAATIARNGPGVSQ